MAAVRNKTRATRLSAQAIGALLLALVVGCAAPPAPSPSPSDPAPPIVIGGCELLEPREVLSGGAAGQPTRVGDRRFAWGSGPDRLTEAVGEFGVGDPESLGIPNGSPQRVFVRGANAVVVPVGDEGVGEIAITWQSADCPYTIWLAPGTTLQDAIRYAARF
jgi:hypothetical protein